MKLRRGITSELEIAAYRLASESRPLLYHPERWHNIFHPFFGLLLPTICLRQYRKETTAQMLHSWRLKLVWLLLNTKQCSTWFTSVRKIKQNSWLTFIQILLKPKVGHGRQRTYISPPSSWENSARKEGIWTKGRNGTSSFNFNHLFYLFVILTPP